MKHISDIMKKQVGFASNGPTILVVAIIFSGLIGCSRCEECELNNNSETICETEFDSPDEYENAIADRESNGATCTSNGGI